MEIDLLNSNLDGQTDDFERKRHGTSRPANVAFHPRTINHLLVTFSLWSTATVRRYFHLFFRTFDDMFMKTSISSPKKSRQQTG